MQEYRVGSSPTSGTANLQGKLSIATLRSFTALSRLTPYLTPYRKRNRTAERELAALQSRRKALEQLELDKEALLEHYARIAPDALDSLMLEERHRLYKMLRLDVFVRPDSSLEVRGVFGESVSLSDSELVPLYKDSRKLRLLETVW